MIKRIFLSILFLFLFNSIHSQNTVGLLSYDPAKAYDGYNLIFPHNQQNVYLLNNCGEIVHTWVDSVYKPGNTAFLQDNGDLIRAGGRGSASNSHIHAGGGGEMVERRNWNGDLEWRYFYNDSLKRMHHDIAVLPNNNILVLAWKKKSKEEAIEAGRDTTNLSQNEIWPEHIVELKPIGADSAEIVWRWNVWDHLIQDFDSTKSNYGVVADHPELIDINYDNNNGKADWLHANSLDYSPEMDQILLSIPYFNEIWIIDHSTTTAEAATNDDGPCSVGGSLMYRWGNPQAYNKGDSTDQKLFFQHDAHWMERHLPNTSPDYGKIMVFNNRVDNSHSAINILNPLFDSYSCKYTFSNTFQPLSFDWTYVHPDTSNTFTTGLGGAQKLPNGNTLVSTGRHGYVYEINSANEIVWEYEIPLLAGAPIDQGTQLSINQNLIFRTYRYPTDFSGFDGKDLSSKGYLESNPDTTFCALILNTNEYEKNSLFSVSPNPSSSVLNLTLSEGNLSQKNKIEIFDVNGRSIYTHTFFGHTSVINCQNWLPGIYFIKLNSTNTQKILKL